MYAALNKLGILTYAKDAKKLDEYYCCKCNRPVKLISTSSRNYFRHFNVINNEINEREIHQIGKKILISILRDFSDIKEEFYLTKIHQRPDIFLNHKIALEYQCAEIKADILEKRVQGYQKMGIKSIWILGGGYLNSQIKRKHLKFINYSKPLNYYLLMLDASKKEFIIFHHIKFIGPFNQIIYQRTNFFTNDFHKVLSFNPSGYEISPILINQHLINRISQRNDSEAKRIKFDFYVNHKRTVEDFLLNKYFMPIDPIYFYPAWQMACGQKKEFLQQPLLQKIK